MNERNTNNSMEVENDDLEHVSGGAGQVTVSMIRGTCPECFQTASAKVNSSGTCSCGAQFCTGYITMFTVDDNNRYLKSFTNVEKYTVE